MVGEHSAKSGADFFATAQREGLLTAEQADHLSRESGHQQIPPGQLALQHGYLTAAQVEVVETLLNPLAAVSGYEIQGLLGHGGMGVVYRARQISLGRVVALKTVLLNSKTSSTRLSRFEQEAQTVGKLLHPHIVTAYDFGRDGQRLYFAMELVDGCDAERWIDREGPLSEATTWGLIRQAAAGLAQASALGVVHRDVKPANLLLVSPPTGFPLPPGLPMVKIADFGLALITDEIDDRTRLTTDNTTVGSPHYMAPEQLGQGEVDHRADIYGLGATAYHMLSGRPPFDGLTLPQIFAQKLNRDPAPLSSQRADLSPESISLIAALMHRDPEQRLAHYGQLLERIDQLRPASVASTGAWTVPARNVSTETQRLQGETAASLPHTPKTIAASAPAGRPGRWLKLAWRVVMVIGLMTGAAIAYSIWRHGSGAPLAHSGELKPSDYRADLFNGVSLEGWQVISGTCSPAEDDEGGVIISANNCLVAVPLVRRLADQQPEPLQHYRLTLNAALRQAQAIELQFGINNQSPAGEQRTVLRLEPDRILLARPAADAAELKPLMPAIQRTLDRERYHELKVERQLTEWRVFVDDQLVGKTPLSRFELPLFRLSVASSAENQPAWIADVMVEELAGPQSHVKP